MSPRNAGRVSWAGLVFGLTAAVAGAQPPEAPAPQRVRLAARFSAGTVERALAGARRRLQRPACQHLFSEFKNLEGRPLTEVLDAKGQSGPEHLGTLLFYDGGSQAPCDRERTLAYTSPGSAIVFVCSEQFTSAARRSPFLAEAAIIHEGLHTLGLGENPPTSAAITARVLHQCGS